MIINQQNKSGSKAFLPDFVLFIIFFIFECSQFFILNQ